jgi:hypothetical protein
MSYCTLEEAFQSSMTDSVLPPMRQGLLEEPSAKGEKGRSKSKKSRRSPLPPQEPSVVEPDRPAHRPKSDAELLGGGAPRNDFTTSLSSYLIGVEDPNEDYFPYPSGGSEAGDFEKQFMLEPNWYEQMQTRMPNPRAETPPLPGASVDGYSTLYKDVPVPKRRDDEARNLVAEEKRGNPQTMAATVVTSDPELHKRIDDLFQKIDNLELSRTESNHSEIILFVMTGIFILLMLDLLLKQGARAIGSIAAASSIPVHMIRSGGALSNPFFF